ncbi:hypothetical protein [Catenovulum sediminis]|uniref:Uncharacterized protein n=1 Tax=Catenovulum sediminis TaxID=1740262 RepID=A0ABV1RI00_9ALTE|nr:hypothetical protein [Catenovulum sediminis]
MSQDISLDQVDLLINEIIIDEPNMMNEVLSSIQLLGNDISELKKHYQDRPKTVFKIPR